MRALLPIFLLIALLAGCTGLSGTEPPSFQPAEDQDLVLDEPLATERVVVRMSAYPFDFAPNQVRVKEGTEVVLQVASVGIEGRFAVEAFDVSFDLVPTQASQASFVASQKGEFALKCTAGCTGNLAGMQARILVE